LAFSTNMRRKMASTSALCGCSVPCEHASFTCRAGAAKRHLVKATA
jgi:hypothetical protein